LSFIVKRQQFCKNCSKGYPGLLAPVHFLENRSNRKLFAAGFGVVLCTLCRVAFLDSPLPFATGDSKEIKECNAAGPLQLLKILAFLYYTLVYYPLLACATVHSRPSHILGALFSWFHLATLICHKIECPRSPTLHSYYDLLASLPQMLCLLYLSVRYPILLVSACRKPVYGCQEEDYESQYVRWLFKRKAPKEKYYNFRHGKQRMSINKINKYFTPQTGFCYPTKMVITALISAITVYQVALVLVVLLVPLLQKVRSGVSVDIVYLLAGFGVILSQDNAEAVEIFKHFLWVLEAVCYVVSVAAACLITIYMLLRTFAMQREHLLAMYRGDTSEIIPKNQSLPSSGLSVVSWMTYSGFQTALIFLGFAIQAIIYYICSVAIAFLLIIPSMYGLTAVALNIVRNMWPFWLMLVLVIVVQHLLARLVFLKKSEHHSSLDNLRLLYITTYMLFCYNIFIGVLTGFWRLIITAMYNTVHLCRMDVSLLSQGVALYDPGYRCYVGFLQLEASHAHPVVRAFCKALVRATSNSSCSASVVPTRDVEEAPAGVQLVQRRAQGVRLLRAHQSRGRWLVAYTLLRNPCLLPRKRTSPPAQGAHS
uniref:Receptor for retinol uptake STRA6 n=1 Tax=Petromyzon marinus TaxID=7757 RepID=S4RC16_PETMA